MEIWNEAKECMSRDQMTQLQSARLKKVVSNVYHNVKFYRQKMQEMGLEPGDIKGIEDLNKLPFMLLPAQRGNRRLSAIREKIWIPGVNVWPDV